MKILFLDQFSDPGGAQLCLLETLAAVRYRGWQGMVALPGDGALFASVRAAGFETARIECGPFASGGKTIPDMARFAAQSPALARRIRALAATFGADVLYINGPRLLPAAALARVHAPTLFHSHSLVPEGLPRALSGHCLRRLGATVVAACRYVAEQWRPYTQPGGTGVSACPGGPGAGPGPGRRNRLTHQISGIRVIYNGVDGPPPAANRPRGVPARIGCIGRIAPEKGQAEFVRAAALVHRALPGCRFLIYGAPLFGDRGALHYAEDVRRSSEGLPIEFRGWSDVHAALGEIDLLLAPCAPGEATTRVILEAFAAGVPAIAFRSGGIPEVVEHGVNGLLAGSVEEMAAHAVELLSDDGARLSALASAARRAWLGRFTPERYRAQAAEAIASAARGFV